MIRDIKYFKLLKSEGVALQDYKVVEFMFVVCESCMEQILVKPNLSRRFKSRQFFDKKFGADVRLAPSGLLNIRLNNKP